jgi:threonine synthase
MVAQLLKRAGKRTWHPERVICVTGGGGAACVAVAGVASAAGLKVVVVVPRPVSFNM